MLVRAQPDPKIFFKVFLELKFQNMVAYLAFDSRSIKALLGKENEQFFDSKYPLFYKNKDGKSSIDVALQNNQIRSVSLMIEYIVHNQNSYFYSHLFEKNLVELL